MKVVHVLRKPCSESTVAANVLRHGTGALNIDATRIGYEHTPNPATNPLYRKLANYKNTYASDAGSSSYSLKDDSGVRNPNAGGRWPANLILQHIPTCEQTGTREEPGYTVNRFTDGAKPFGGGAGHPYESEHVPPSTVPVWTCAPGCPVAGLDAQSGMLKSGVMTGMQRGFGLHGIYGEAGLTPATCYGDTGGASRYFKQVGGKVRVEE